MHIRNRQQNKKIKALPHHPHPHPHRLARHQASMLSSGQSAVAQEKMLESILCYPERAFLRTTKRNMTAKRGPIPRPRIHVASSWRGWDAHVARCHPNVEEQDVAEMTEKGNSIDGSKRASDEEEEEEHSQSSTLDASCICDGYCGEKCTTCTDECSSISMDTNKHSHANITNTHTNKNSNTTACTFPGCRLRPQEGRRAQRRHMRLFHFERPIFPCAGCHFTCHSAATLRAHIRRTHASMQQRKRVNQRLSAQLVTFQRQNGSCRRQPGECLIVRAAVLRGGNRVARRLQHRQTLLASLIPPSGASSSSSNNIPGPT